MKKQRAHSRAVETICSGGQEEHFQGRLTCWASWVRGRSLRSSSGFRGGSRGGSELLPMRLDALFAEKKGAEPPAATLLRTVQGDWPTEQLPTERRIGNRSIPIFECCFGIAMMTVRTWPKKDKDVRTWPNLDYGSWPYHLLSKPLAVAVLPPERFSVRRGDAQDQMARFITGLTEKCGHGLTLAEACFPK